MQDGVHVDKTINVLSCECESWRIVKVNETEQ